jgi:hypothetical protein
MTVTCPSGHESEWPDFCSVCGVSLQPASSAPPATDEASPGGGTGSTGAVAAPAPSSADVAPAASPPGPTCPNCGYARDVTDVFCESCGFDFIAGTMPAAPVVVPAAGTDPATGAGPPDATTDPASGATASGAAGAAPVTASWWAVVEADRAYYDREHAGGPVPFPDPAPASVSVPLITAVARIGRRSASRGLAPEIDLAGPPEDPAVSHRHAELRRQPDGTYVLVDVGSTNGTKLDDGTDPLAADTVHPLADRSRLYLGAWTRITIERR